MGERVVSVKMPASLVARLRERTHQDHYLDLSEQLRSIVRAACLKHTRPYSDEIARLRDDIERSAQSSAAITREQVLKDLMHLLKEGGK